MIAVRNLYIKLYLKKMLSHWPTRLFLCLWINWMNLFSTKWSDLFWRISSIVPRNSLCKMIDPIRLHPTKIIRIVHLPVNLTIVLSRTLLPSNLWLYFILLQSDLKLRSHCRTRKAPSNNGATMERIYHFRWEETIQERYRSVVWDWATLLLFFCFCSIIK